MPRLTKRLCETAPAGTTWDTELPGFGLRVLASGRRSYIVRYRTAGGTDRLVTIGTTAEFQPDEARERARDIKRSVREGRDPKADRTAARQAGTSPGRESNGHRCALSRYRGSTESELIAWTSSSGSQAA